MSHNHKDCVDLKGRSQSYVQEARQINFYIGYCVNEFMSDIALK